MASPSTSPSPAEPARKITFRSKIDWWIWAVFAFSLCIGISVTISGSLWLGILYELFFIVLFGVGIFGCRYVIDGDTLVVYNMFHPMRMPIAKIKDLRLVRSYIAGPAMSTRRISIRFIDHSVLKSSMPIEISPLDREGFVDALRAVNPAIEVLP